MFDYIRASTVFVVYLKNNQIKINTSQLGFVLFFVFLCSAIKSGQSFPKCVKSGCKQGLEFSTPNLEHLLQDKREGTKGRKFLVSLVITLEGKYSGLDAKIGQALLHSYCANQPATTHPIKYCDWPQNFTNNDIKGKKTCLTVLANLTKLHLPSFRKMNTWHYY